MTSEVALDLRQPEVIIRAMLTPDRAIDDFLDDCRRRRYSERTIQTYRRILDQFADRLPRDYDVSKISTADVERFLGTKTHLSTGTVAHAEAVCSSWLKWLYKKRKIAANPVDRMDRTRRIPSEDLDVLTLSTDDVRKLLHSARAGSERNALYLLACLGPRRRAVAQLRLRDYDRVTGQIRFREKGAKTIWKPVPAELVAILEASLTDGLISEPDDYLVPPEGPLWRKGDRDDRVIWRVVKKVADRAGVDANVRALRAAFAVFYIEQNPQDVLGLKELMGHRSIQTTMIYLRRLNKQTAMEPVRTLSWGVAENGNERASRKPQIAEKRLESFPVVGAGGFEPPFTTNPDEHRDARQLPSDLDPKPRRKAGSSRG